MDEESRKGILATDGTRNEHGKRRGRKWGSAGASPSQLARIEGRIREGERPRRILSSPGAPPMPKDGPPRELPPTGRARRLPRRDPSAYSVFLPPLTTLIPRPR